MRKLYLECTSGISGDMFTAALLDLGADEKKLKTVLDTVPLEGFRTEVGRVKKSGLDVCDFRVMLEKEYENHDHDMDYLYGEHGHGHSHAHPHGYAEEQYDSGEEHDYHGHEHPYSHGEEQHASGEEHHHHGHGHPHRGMREVTEIIEHTEMTETAKALALRIFEILGRAEAEAHGTTLEQVHFHEVGAVDSIVDIVAAAVCMDDLGVTEVIIPSVSEGTGNVRCQHGILPVPVPAVLNIVRAEGLPLCITDRKGELVTPTGAAIAAAICTSNRLPDTFRIVKTGMGAGKREYEIPSILRAMLIEDDSETREKICKLETNIDDCSGEILGAVMELLFEAGAKDVCYKPIYMKKNRPAYELDVLCAPEDAEKMEEIIFRGTTTIGIRRCVMERTVLPREIREIETSLGTVTVKVCDVYGEKRIYPEYESALKVGRAAGIPLSRAYRRIERELHGYT